MYRTFNRQRFAFYWNKRGICSEKFTKCSLHSPHAGCIIVALYWLNYTMENILASERRKWIDGMQRMRLV